MNLQTLAGFAFIFLGMSTSHAQTEYVIVAAETKNVSAASTAAIQKLTENGLESELDVPGMNAQNSERHALLTKAIMLDSPMTAFGYGTKGVAYDVILQPGHYGRRTGAVGTTGKTVTERELVAYIVNKASAELKGKGLNVLVVPADNSTKGLEAKIFLSVHADGATASCTTGPSLAYEDNSSLLAMHAIGWALAQSLGYSYEQFRKDGYTVNSARYYMFPRIKTSVMKGLLEIGELTCDTIEPRLITSADMIGKNLARAIIFVGQLDTAK